MAKDRRSLQEVQDATEKEDLSVERGKRTVSIAGLFANIKSKRVKISEENVTHDNGHGPASSTQRKPRAAARAAEDFFAEFTTESNAPEHPVFCGFEDIVNEYEEGVQASMDSKLQPICDELEARSKGFDINGKPVSRPGVPSAADVEALEAAYCIVSKPLPHEELRVETPQGDGGKVIKRVTLASVIDAYRQLESNKGAELASLNQELAHLEADLVAAYQTVDDDAEDDDIKYANERWELDKARFHEACKAAKDQLATEFEKARAEDKAASAKTNQQIQEFMMAFQ